MGLEKRLSSGINHSCVGREKYSMYTHKKSSGCLLKLLQLSVRDFAIAEQIDLHLEASMTVISGETGAGKSILLDALGLALGDRATSDSALLGADKADISAVFDISKIPEAQASLNEYDLHLDIQ